MKKIPFLLLLLGLLLFAGCTKTIAITDLTFENGSIVMVDGETQTLEILITPLDATEVALEWTSNNPTVVSISNKGVAVAHKPGIATITVKYGDIEAQVEVTVNAVMYTVTYDTDGGSSVLAEAVNEGTLATEPTDPTKDGYTFDGWFDESLTTPFDFNTPITANITVYAKFTINTYQVTFNSDGGSEVATQSIDYGTVATEVTDPTKDGYTFDGWYQGDEEFSFSNPITSDITLMARWIANEDTPYTVHHYVMNLSTSNFELVATEQLTGTTGETVQAVIRTYQGMMPEQETYEGVIVGDGSLVIDVRYVEFKYGYTLSLNGGNFTYQTRDEMVEDFLADYNTAFNTTYTVATLPMGSWTLTNFHTFFLNPTYKDKWMWLPTYLGVVGSSTNKKACSDITKVSTTSAYTAINGNWIYALSYEVRGFITGTKFTNNANWMSSDYSTFELANGFWETFVTMNEDVTFADLKDPATLPKTAYRDGYVFDGWYLNANFSGEAITTIDHNATIYAKWQVNNPVTAITITNPIATMEKYATHQLVISIEPTNAYNKNVVYSSSNQTILKVSDEGLITAYNAGQATITIQSVMGGVMTTMDITVVAQDNLDVRFESGYNGTLLVNGEVQITTTGFGQLSQATATFVSTNPSILSVSATGKVTALALGEGNIEISVGGTVYVTATIVVVPPTASERADQLLALLIANSEPVVDSVNASLYYDDYSAFQQYYDAVYSSVNLYLFDDMNIDRTTYLINPSVLTNKTSGLKPSTEFITVHDTANISGGLTNHGSYWLNGSHSTSIHFTVGDYGVIQDLDTRYIAHHAGDGTGTTFSFNDTGIAANGNLNPEIAISPDGYFTFNGVKSIILAPKNDSNQILDASYFTNLGPTWKIGNDGNYYLGTSWFVDSQVTRGVIASHGGNNNSTGIEMCVNTNGDIYDTWQRTAKLVASLLVEHQLGLDRVVQHNSFTGKNCPQSLIMSSYWDRFMKMVEVEYLVLTQYSDATITFTSNNLSMVSATGRVIGKPNTTAKVSYTISVSVGGVNRSITLSSLIPGLASWSQKDGFYPTR